MNRNERMTEQRKTWSLENRPTEKEVFHEVAEVIRENFVAVYTKESDTSLIMRFVSGLQFRIKMESVERE